MGSIVGAITGTTAAGKKAAAAQREAAEMARYKPWDVSGSYFGDSDFNYEDLTASYNLSPPLQQLRDMYMTQALSYPRTGDVEDASVVQDYGRNLFKEATTRDVSADANQYYQNVQNLLTPDRERTQQMLANNLFASGRMGQATANSEGTGYVNPERMEYLTALNRENNSLAMDAQAKAEMKRDADLQKGMGFYGMGQQLAMKPYEDAYKMFGYGAGIEETGQQPMNQGIALGSAAQSGNVARANGYMAAAQSQLNSSLANAGMFTQLIGGAMGSDGLSGFSNPFSAGGSAGGYTGGGTFMPASSGFAGSPHLRSMG
jgi:hypothetical protein